jgi:membrane protein DedA with SNARE-associated domain
MMSVWSRSNLKFREKLPQLLVITVIAIAVGIIVLDTLEDMLIEGSAFAGTPVAMLLNAMVSFTLNVTAIVQSWGYVGLFVAMALESSSLPIPSEVILPFAGYLVSQGLLNFWLAVLISTLAGLAGSLIDYLIGLRGMSMLAKRSSLRSLLYSKGRMDTAEKWFDRYGAPFVFLSRMLPGFRTLISFPAGAVKMSLSKFIAYTTAGCLIWDVILIYLGVYVGDSWRKVAGVARYLIIAAAVAFIVVLAVFLIRRRKKVKKRESSFNKCFDQQELS